MSRPLRIGSPHYGWIVAATAFVVLIVAAGIRATPGVLAVAINLALYGIVGPFAAALMQTFGLGRTMVSGLTIVTGGVFAAGFASEPWQPILTQAFRATAPRPALAAA